MVLSSLAVIYILNKPVTNQDIKKAFLKERPSWEGNFNILVKKYYKNYAIGVIHWYDINQDSYWFAVRDKINWQIVSHGGNSYFGICQDFEKYNFPKEMIPDCWDKEKKIIVNTSNPDEFYNGLTVKDKNKLIQAYLDFRNQDNNLQSRELFIKFNEQQGNTLKGSILIGGIDNYSTPYFLAVKIYDDWKVLYYGQEDPFCDDIEGYDIPVSFVTGCWVNGHTRIERE